MKRILIYADTKNENGSTSACEQVVEQGKTVIQGIHLEDGDFKADFSFEDLVEMAKIRNYFCKPLWERIKSMSSEWTGW